MAMSEEERKERAKKSQYKYNQSAKGKARNRKWETENPNGIKYRQKYREKNREYFIEKSKQYRETEAYKNSIKKYQSSEKYQETRKRYYESDTYISRLKNGYKKYAKLITEEINDGKNNNIKPILTKPKNEKEIEMIEFTDDFINHFCDEWLEWLDTSLYQNSSNCWVFRKETSRTTYYQYIIYYKQKFGQRVSLIQLEDEFLKNDLLRKRMKEIDATYLHLLEMYMTSGKINAVASKFLFTNRYGWQDVKHQNNTTTIEKIIWNENLYIDAQIVDDKQLSPSPPKLNESNDDFDFEEL